MSKIVELFGETTLDGTVRWNEVIADQTRPFLEKVHVQHQSIF